MSGDEAPIPTRAQRRGRGRWPVRIGEERHTATDLSLGGLFLADVVHHPIGARLQVELAVAGPPLHVDAVVRWIREHRVGAGLLPGCGLAFEGLTDADRARIHLEISGVSP